MQKSENKLVDVVKLSRERCDHPIQCLLAYATKENFLGRIVDGYHADAAHLGLMTLSTAEALCEVQHQLNKMQLGLFVFDSYRPLRSVRDFKAWMHQAPAGEYELERKQIHYPHIDKSQLSELGYVADTVSNHCFGDTVDLSLIDLKTNTLLNMGACFDYFDEISYPSASAEVIGEEGFQNRLILTKAMKDAHFIPYAKEFWHFTFHKREVSEPIDVEITANFG